MKKLLHLVIGCLVPLFLMEGEIYSQDIEGLEIGSTVTKTQVVNKFGTPDKYEIQHWDTGDGPNEKGEFFKYDIDSSYLHKSGLYIELMDDMLTGFVVRNSQYCAFTKMIPGGIRVGDSFSAIDNYLIFEKKTGYYGEEYCQAYVTEYGHSIRIHVEGEKIIQIECSGGE